jgi:hypothetical protein
MIPTQYAGHLRNKLYWILGLCGLARYDLEQANNLIDHDESPRGPEIDPSHYSTA